VDSVAVIAGAVAALSAFHTVKVVLQRVRQFVIKLINCGLWIVEKFHGL